MSFFYINKPRQKLDFEFYLLVGCCIC